MFVRAEKGKGLSVIYHRNDGGKLVKTGGTPAWRNNNPIIAYQIERKGWLSKPQLIALIELEGGIDAVVVRPSGRRPFIRMRPDSTRLNNLNA